MSARNGLLETNHTVVNFDLYIDEESNQETAIILSRLNQTSDIKVSQVTFPSVGLSTSVDASVEPILEFITEPTIIRMSDKKQNCADIM